MHRFDICPSYTSRNSAILDHTEWKKPNELHFLLGMWLQSKHTSLLGAYFLLMEMILVHVLTMRGGGYGGPGGRAMRRYLSVDGDVMVDDDDVTVDDGDVTVDDDDVTVDDDDVTVDVGNLNVIVM